MKEIKLLLNIFFGAIKRKDGFDNVTPGKFFSQNILPHKIGSGKTGSFRYRDRPICYIETHQSGCGGDGYLH